MFSFTFQDFVVSAAVFMFSTEMEVVPTKIPTEVRSRNTHADLIIDTETSSVIRETDL